MKALKVFGVIFSVLFSILLVVMLVITPIYSSAYSVMEKPSVIADAVKEEIGDFKDLFLEQNEDAANDEETMLAAEMLNAFMETEVANKLVDAYASDILATVQGNMTEQAFTAENMEAIFNDHMDEIVAMVQDYIPEEDNLTQEEIREGIEVITQELTQELVQLVPSAEEMSTALEETGAAETIRTVTDPKMRLILWGICAGLALLIVVCLLPGVRFCLCLGIDALISGLALLGIALSVDYVMPLLLHSIGSGAGSIGLVFGVVTDKILLAAICILVAGVLLIAGHIVIQIFRNKKEERKLQELRQVVVVEGGEAAIPVAAPEREAQPVYTAPVYNPPYLQNDPPATEQETCGAYGYPIEKGPTYNPVSGEGI